jgi:hypothetical protein
MYFFFLFTSMQRCPSLWQTTAFLVKSNVWARFFGRDNLAKNVPTKQAWNKSNEIAQLTAFRIELKNASSKHKAHLEIMN